MSEILKNNGNDDIVNTKTEDFVAVFVNSFEQYQQKDYNKILLNNNGNSIKLWAWKNDKAIAEFAILTADKVAHHVTLTASDLIGEKENIQNNNVSLSFIKEVKAYTGHAGWYAQNPKQCMPRGERESYPEVIYSDNPISIDKDTVQLVWVQINVPKNIANGIYRGTVIISADNIDNKAELNIELEVLNITMPEPDKYLFDVEYWSHPYNVAYYYDVEPFSDKHLQILEQHMSLYKSLGGHAITASIVEEAWGGQTYGGNNSIHYPSMIKWIKSDSGEWKFDFTQFDKWVQLNKQIGIADKIICYSMMPWKNTVRYYNESTNKLKKIKINPASKAKYCKVWRPFLKAFIEHIDDKGWFDTIYMGFDERRNMETALDLIASLKNKDGKTLKISASFNDFKHNAAIFNRLDYASVGLQQIRNNLSDFKEQVKLRRANNQETTMYTATEHVPNSFTKSIPVESYWTIMFAGALDTTGFLRWAYDAWVENPLEESTHWSFPAGDCFLVYPSAKDDVNKESKLSVRLAKLDEGVRDINKLYLLRNMDNAVSDKIEKLFSQIKGDKENSYEFYTIAKTNFWGRTAKWLTEKGKNNMIEDMKKVKQSIYEISKIYCENLNK